ncbi:aspartate/glutamate racemase family protein [Mesorhizobium sp. DCY119]|uniref:aspartate/glutamate racemase family protein n=1 Tax=Mesorhizobium sp. DCY119 TaxID=2108445 RepID=UPI000E6C3907|nr:aspartate/glutamate racemase family protein [Mesorhizobium sp. DCY119]RJG46067.1 hypothetical protein D3Y55_18645 [Mesorhizobium sp. DCY119]
MRIAAISPSADDGLPEEEMVRRQKRLESYMSPGTEFEQLYIAGNSIFNEKFSWKHGLDVMDRTAALAIKAAETRPDVIMIQGGIEPGVKAAREKIKDIPIVSTGQSTYNAAFQLGEQVGYKLGLIVYEDPVIEPIMDQARYYRADWMVTDCRSIGIPTNELYPRRPEVRERVIAVAKDLVRDGATMIFPQGLSMCPATIGEDELSAEIGVPVLNGLKILVRTAEMMGSLRMLSHAAQTSLR